MARPERFIVTSRGLCSGFLSVARLHKIRGQVVGEEPGQLKFSRKKSIITRTLFGKYARLGYKSQAAVSKSVAVTR